MPVTIKDISNKLHLSPGAISQILNGKYKNGHVKFRPETIRMVEEYAKKIKYRSNHKAAAYLDGKLQTIGVYMPIFGNPIFTMGPYHLKLLESIQKAAFEREYNVLLINFSSIDKGFDSEQMDGLIILERTDEETELIKELTKKNRPFLLIDNQMPMNGTVIPSVNVNNKIGIEKVVHHFIINGHRDLAFIGHLFENENREFVLRSVLFKEILGSSGLPVHGELFIHGIMPELPRQLDLVKSGYYGMKYLMEKHRTRFTGVFCANDFIAIGALQYLIENAPGSSGEISIIGFDDIPSSEFIFGGVTTVHQPLEIIGRVAVLNLLSLINKKLSQDQYFIEVPPELVLRKFVYNLKK